jgi:hypothetical protein
MHDETDKLTRIIDTKDAGSLKIAGKTVTVDGLVSRGGKRRVFTDSPDYEWMELRAEQLREIARKVLTGRRRDVFELMVIGPLMGDEKPEVRKLVDKYSVPPKRIYEDLARAKEQVKAHYEKKKPIRASGPRSGERCPTCGALYDSIDPWSLCRRGYGRGIVFQSRLILDQVHPDCLPPARKANAVQTILRLIPTKKMPEALQ